MSKEGRGKSWEDVDSGLKGKNYTDVFDAIKFPDGEWVSLRLVGDVYPLDIHWIPTTKRGSKDATGAYPVICLSSVDKKCACCDIGMKRQTLYYSNVISRDAQENEPSSKNRKSPPKDAKFRNKGDKWWSPVYAARFPYGAGQKIKALTALNKVKDKKTGEIKTFPVNHPKYGCDILVQYDSTQSGSGMYSIQKGDKSPLTDEEKELLLYNLDEMYNATKSYKDLVESIKRAFDQDLLDEDNCDLKAVKKLLRGDFDNKKNKDEDDDDEIDDMEDIDDDEESKNKSKKNKDNKKGKKSKEYDEDDDLDDEDDDEDEEPKKKSKKNKDKKNDKKSRDDEDDDLDDEEDEDELDEDDDLDDEDEEPKKKSKKNKDKKNDKKSRDDDEDDDLDEDLDEEDEDELDEDDDLDDEDEEPKKKSKKNKKRK